MTGRSMSSAGMTTRVAVRFGLGVGLGGGRRVAAGVGAAGARGPPVARPDGEPVGATAEAATPDGDATLEGDASALKDGNWSDGRAITVGGATSEEIGASVGAAAGS